jgi:hypothetical protein
MKKNKPDHQKTGVEFNACIIQKWSHKFNSLFFNILEPISIK